MKHIIVGDIHGDEGAMYYALNRFPDAQLLFLGDFLDSFEFTSEECVRALTLALNLIEEGRATGIIGNHELSYVKPQWRCSGHNPVTQAHVFPLVSRITRLLQPYIYNADHRVLITHAGLSRPVWDENNMTFENVDEKLFAGYRDHDSFFFQVGRKRGGWARWGGPVWCDWSEFTPIDGLRQVFGHSAGLVNRPEHEETVGLMRKCGENWNVDCLQRGRSYLEFNDETGTLQVIACES